jgi:hypothetical protein
MNKYDRAMELLYSSSRNNGQKKFESLSYGARMELLKYYLNNNVRDIINNLDGNTINYKVANVIPIPVRLLRPDTTYTFHITRCNYLKFCSSDDLTVIINQNTISFMQPIIDITLTPAASTILKVRVNQPLSIFALYKTYLTTNTDSLSLCSSSSSSSSVNDNNQVNYHGKYSLSIQTLQIILSNTFQLNLPHLMQIDLMYLPIHLHQIKYINLL